VKDGITDEKWPVNLACDSDFRVNHRVFFNMLQMFGFTSPLKEGMLWIFLPEKWMDSAGFKPTILGTSGQHANH
jgi:hypothetical protein